MKKDFSEMVHSCFYLTVVFGIVGIFYEPAIYFCAAAGISCVLFIMIDTLVDDD